MIRGIATAPAVTPGEMWIGDVRDFAAGLERESVQCLVTSPPYYGLRDYPIAPAVWGGEPGCDHAWGDALVEPWANGLPGPQGRTKNSGSTRRRARTSGRWCGRCGAWLGQLGGEPTVDAFVAHLVEVCRLLRPALRRDGTCWLNIGDCYAHRSARDGERRGSSDGAVRRSTPQQMRVKAHGALKHKDLCLVPFRLVIALQEDGWYVRTEIIWEKGNGLPEAVRDRPVRCHEYLFLLTRSPRYAYDPAAIAEPVTGNAHSRWKGRTPKGETARGRANNSWQGATTALVERRNARSVWRINPEPFPGEHDSTYPRELVRRCLLAGSRPGDLVCDPFGGTGTLAVVAEELGRRWVSGDADPQARAWLAERRAAASRAPGAAPTVSHRDRQGRAWRQMTIFDVLPGEAAD